MRGNKVLLINCVQKANTNVENYNYQLFSINFKIHAESQNAAQIDPERDKFIDNG